MEDTLRLEVKEDGGGNAVEKEDVQQRTASKETRKPSTVWQQPAAVWQRSQARGADVGVDQDANEVLDSIDG